MHPLQLDAGPAIFRQQMFLGQITLKNRYRPHVTTYKAKMRIFVMSSNLIATACGANKVREYQAAGLRMYFSVIFELDG